MSTTILCIVAVMVAQGLACAGLGACMAWWVMRDRVRSIHDIYRAINRR